VALAEEIGDDIPTMDDFFGDQKNQEKDPSASVPNQRKSMILPSRKQRGSNFDTKVFDQKLVDRALALLLDY
jgi:hypothetical protein